MGTAFDAAWRARALRGDEAAVARLTAWALVPLYRFCFYRVGRRRELCEEAVQETVLRALRDLERYDPARSQGDIGPWLRGLARNEVRRVLARERPGARLDAAWERLDEELLAVYARLDASPLGDDHLEREETRDLVNATMSQLPDRHRADLLRRLGRPGEARPLLERLAAGPWQPRFQLRQGQAREALGRPAFDIPRQRN